MLLLNKKPNNMKKNTIRNKQDLKREVQKLNQVKRQQEEFLMDQYHLLKQKVNAPLRFANKFMDFVPGADFAKGLFSFKDYKNIEQDKDWLSKGFRIILPFFLNKTILRKSGWLKKALVFIASDGVIGQLNKDKAANILDKVTSFISPKKKKKRKKDTSPIPRYSEFEDTPLMRDLPEDHELRSTEGQGK